MSLYVRIKRKTATVFLHVEPPETFAQIKERCGQVFSTPPSEINLFSGSIEAPSELPDAATIGDHQIENDAVIYMVFKKGDSWEEIDIDAGET